MTEPPDWVNEMYGYWAVLTPQPSWRGRGYPREGRWLSFMRKFSHMLTDTDYAGLDMQGDTCWESFIRRHGIVWSSAPIRVSGLCNVGNFATDRAARMQWSAHTYLPL